MQNKQIKHFFFLVSICITLFICMYYGLPIIRNLILPVSRVYVYGIGNLAEEEALKVMYIDKDYYYESGGNLFKYPNTPIDEQECINQFTLDEQQNNCLYSIYDYKFKQFVETSGNRLYSFGLDNKKYVYYSNEIVRVKEGVEKHLSYLISVDKNWKTNQFGSKGDFILSDRYLFTTTTRNNQIDQMRGINYLNKVDMETGTVQQIPLNQSDAVTNITLDDNSIIALVNDFEAVPKGHKYRLKYLLSSILYRIDSDTLEKEILYQAKDKQIIIGYHNHFVYVLEHKTIHKINVDTKETVKSYRFTVEFGSVYVYAIKDKLFIRDRDNVRLIIDYQDE